MDRPPRRYRIPRPRPPAKPLVEQVFPYLGYLALSVAMLALLVSYGAFAANPMLGASGEQTVLACVLGAIFVGIQVARWTIVIMYFARFTLMQIQMAVLITGFWFSLMWPGLYTGEWTEFAQLGLLGFMSSCLWVYCYVSMQWPGKNRYEPDFVSEERSRRRQLARTQRKQREEETEAAHAR
jgi:hypothetical protein